MFSFRKPLELPTAARALPGRATPMPLPHAHRVFGIPLDHVPERSELAMFGLGCFWGAERLFYRIAGVTNTAVGYAGGHTPNPTYEEVCTGMTGHNEVVRVAFDPRRVRYEELLRTFFEAHDPTQGMRQGNDVGTQYRSGIYTHGDGQHRIASTMAVAYAKQLAGAGYRSLTTEVLPAPTFYFAEGYHQQYLDAHPDGYCGLQGTGVACTLPRA